MRTSACFVGLLIVITASLSGQNSPPSAQAVREFNLTRFGGVGDGKTLNTDAFRKAIEACAAVGGRVVVPSGTFLTGPIQLLSHVDLHVDAGAVVLFSPKFEDFPLALVNYEGRDAVECRSPVWGEHLERVSITGPGRFDAQGDHWRPTKKVKVTTAHWAELLAAGGVISDDGGTWYPSAAAKGGEADLKKQRESGQPLKVEDYQKFRELLRPALLLLTDCKDVKLDGPTFANSPNWNLHLLLCDGVTAKNLTIDNPAYAQNGDGIDLDSCRNVVLKDSSIEAGDDGICLKSGRDEEGRKRGKPTENVTITNCTVGHAHGGFVIGSEMSGGVRNVTVTHCTFTGTDNGLRFKSTRGRGGVVENIQVSDITMSDIHDDAITFDMYYMIKGGGKGEATAEPVGEGTPMFRNFTIKDINCKGAKKAILIRGLPEMPIEGISLSSVRIDADQGMSLIDAKDISLKDVTVTCNVAPGNEIRNVVNLKTDDFKADVAPRTR